MIPPAQRAFMVMYATGWIGADEEGARDYPMLKSALRIDYTDATDDELDEIIGEAWCNVLEEDA